jgi:GGDEF domain-containing protein
VTQGGEESALEAALAAIRATLRGGRRAPLPAELAASADLAGLLDDLAELYRFTLAISPGGAERPLSVRGSLAGSLKTLDAAVRHLTWQTQRVAAGDFTQRVDFMGDFSEAFKSTVVALDKARTELDERNELLQAQALKLEELASSDALTGAYDRRKFNELILAEIERVQRYGLPLSLFILDIDHVKRVNHTHGHEAGDEEFVVLSPGVTLERAAEPAERLRAAAKTYDHAGVGTVSASIGVAQHRGAETPDELFARADAALFAAKEGGRDRVEVAR